MASKVPKSPLLRMENNTFLALYSNLFDAQRTAANMVHSVPTHEVVRGCFRPVSPSCCATTKAAGATRRGLYNKQCCLLLRGGCTEEGMI